MIKFFRHIRQRLVTENKFSKSVSPARPNGLSGRTGRYILYAIGEIILVVIGILIALQINNWNERRKLQEEINTYLTQKLVNLKEDQLRLVELREFRLNAAEKSKQLLDFGLKKTNVFDLIETTKQVFTERRFATTVERNETSTTKYYLSKKEAEINNLEQEYMRLIELVMFEENRLNTFSESIEIDLWRNGYFNDNRRLYNSMIKDLKPSDFANDTIPALILNKDNGQQSLEGLLNRNEIANPSIALKLKKLIQTNKKLISVIETYLNS